MRITHIFIYPIKSCGGISLSSGELTKRGLQNDRRWMLVSPDGMCLTQRDIPEMALIRTRIEGEVLRIWHQLKKIAPLEIPLSIEKQSVKQVTLWGDSFEVSVYKESVNQWFSGVLGSACELVYMHEESRRPVDPRYAKNGEIVSMADGYPNLIIGQASLDLLNETLQGAGNSPVPMNRFRPNIVFEGGRAHEEDMWNEVQIGDVTFHAAKPCARCTLTTIDQDTAEKGKEPLRTLTSYRKEDNKVLFGMNLLHNGSGVIKVGDEIRSTSA